MRRLFPSDLIPVSFRESFRIVFNFKYLPDLVPLHSLYLKHLCFEDLDFACTQALPTLLQYLRNFERYDVPILALQILDFMLNPLYEFKNQYLALWPNQGQFL